MLNGELQLQLQNPCCGCVAARSKQGVFAEQEGMFKKEEEGVFYVEEGVFPGNRV